MLGTVKNFGFLHKCALISLINRDGFPGVQRVIDRKDGRGRCRVCVFVLPLAKGHERMKGSTLSRRARFNFYLCLTRVEISSTKYVDIAHVLSEVELIDLSNLISDYSFLICTQSMPSIDSQSLY